MQSTRHRKGACLDGLGHIAQAGLIAKDNLELPFLLPVPRELLGEQACAAVLVLCPTGD